MKFIGISTEGRRIIGVVPDVDDENIIPSPAMTVYQPSNQEGWNGRLFVRAKNDPYAVRSGHPCRCSDRVSFAGGPGCESSPGGSSAFGVTARDI